MAQLALCEMIPCVLVWREIACSGLHVATPYVAGTAVRQPKSLVSRVSVIWVPQPKLDGVVHGAFPA
eukprot:4448914-Pleurochrysis_carterae.AAC.1